VNFGLFPPLERRFKKRERKAAHVARARAALRVWLDGLVLQAPDP
jgi:folate-dependent tRNA-U54 methylase TrmFO/GidA